MHLRRVVSRNRGCRCCSSSPMRGTARACTRDRESVRVGTSTRAISLPLAPDLKHGIFYFSLPLLLPSCSQPSCSPLALASGGGTRSSLAPLSLGRAIAPPLLADSLDSLTHYSRSPLAPLSLPEHAQMGSLGSRTQQTRSSLALDARADRLARLAHTPASLPSRSPLALSTCSGRLDRLALTPRSLGASGSEGVRVSEWERTRAT